MYGWNETAWVKSPYDPTASIIANRKALTPLATAGSAPGYEYIITDEAGKIALGIREDGTVEIPALADTEIAGGEFVGASGYPGYTFVLTDANGRIALGIKDDGTVVIPVLEITDNAGNEIVEVSGYPGYAFVLTDAGGQIALGVRDDGTVEIPALQSFDTESVRLSGTYSHSLNYICNAGQSLAGGSDGEITLTQEYDSVGFPAHASSPSAAVPLTVSNTQWSARGESPIYGTCGFIKELIHSENGLGYEDLSYRLLGCNNGDSGETIAALSKGGTTGMYEAAISQAVAAQGIAKQALASASFQAVTWTQGEADIAAGTSQADYLAA
ncbi:hypothetical protein, partial [Microbulbifer variabilis]|uniref:hypothetical protein n=1 Tax=Microbulbifer variabilis TaxID=266805 RepID=UPI001CFE0B86